MERIYSGRQLRAQDLEGVMDDLELDQYKRKYGVCALVKEDNQYRCQRCNNSENFALICSGEEAFCCHCLQLGRLTTADTLIRFPELSPENLEKSDSVLTWEGQLSKEQKRASDCLVASLNQKNQIEVIYAVTGAGKTEMIFQVIDKVLSQGGRVAVVSPRVDVCRELGPRLQAAFQSIPLIVLHGEMDQPYYYTQLLVATNHQLWKFYHAFDLIIVDEVDAFPLVGDQGLHFGVDQAIKPSGKIVYLTATPDDYIRTLEKQARASITRLPARYHGYPLPEPVFKWIGDWQEQIQRKKQGAMWRLIEKFRKQDGVKLIFMPHIELAKLLFEKMVQRGWGHGLDLVHAKDPCRAQKVQSLREGKISCLITTTILERGVTFTNCQVLILGSEHVAFTRSALVQMSGRVGRKADFPSGILWYGHFGISRAMRQARTDIIHMNRLARQMGLLREARD